MAGKRLCFGLSQTTTKIVKPLHAKACQACPHSPIAINLKTKHSRVYSCYCCVHGGTSFAMKKTNFQWIRGAPPSPPLRDWRRDIIDRCCDYDGSGVNERCDQSMLSNAAGSLNFGLCTRRTLQIDWAGRTKLICPQITRRCALWRRSTREFVGLSLRNNDGRE